MASIQDQFEKFDRLNPWVYEWFVEMTRYMKDRGRTKIGIGMLTEVLRWEYWKTTDDPSSDFKISNNYRSRYVRKIRAEHPDLADMFNIKPLRSP